MNKLNVGDYVRTKYGINKIISNPNENKFNIDAFKKDGITLRCIRQKDVVKSNPQIIDLIEENDLIKYRINGDLYVSEVKGHPEFDKYKLHIEYLDTIIDLNDLSIVSIITHEQFENISYKVGE